MKTAAKLFLTVLISLLVGFCIFETIILVFLHNPPLAKNLPEVALKNLRSAYQYTRSIIQLEPICSRFDKEVGYTLKPGRCTFSNIEFKSEYFVNSQGLRDSESALDKPEVIVVGDSFAMGWGVNQNEIFAKVLERMGNMKVLNAAVSSFGTAREMMMLRRLDTSAMKYLVIQYYENDYWENLVYYLNKNYLSEEILTNNYNAAIRQYRSNKHYFFGKYTVSILVDKIKKWRKVMAKKNEGTRQKGIFFSDNNLNTRRFYEIKISADRDLENFFTVDKSLSETLRKEKMIQYFYVDKDEGDLFLNAIMNSGVDLSDTQIIALTWTAADARFFQALKRKIIDGEYPAYIKKMVLVNAIQGISKEDVYVLDDHPRSVVHKLVAEIILNIIKPGGYIDQRRP